jgi:hypothetical protein
MATAAVASTRPVLDPRPWSLAGSPESGGRGPGGLAAQAGANPRVPSSAPSPLSRAKRRRERSGDVEEGWVGGREKL